MPDVHRCRLEWLAPFRIYERDPQLKRYAGFSFRQIASGFSVINVVRSFFLFRCERASRCGGKNSRRRRNRGSASDHERAPVEIHIEFQMGKLPIQVLHGSKNKGLRRWRL
jgi:hypothetical protein